MWRLYLNFDVSIEQQTFSNILDDIQSGYKLALSSQEDVLNKILLREQVELEVQLNQAILDEVSNLKLAVRDWMVSFNRAVLQIIPQKVN